MFCTLLLWKRTFQWLRLHVYVCIQCFVAMPDLASTDVYSSQQINIPPTFPFILKQYAKAAIRTQPYDLLRWSAAYFRALAKGETPPTKERLEYPPPDTPSGLSPGYLRVLIKQLGKGGFVTVNDLFERWNGICLAEQAFHEMLAVGQFGETFEWLHFVAVAAGFLSKNLTQTMILLCTLLTDEPDGGSASIPLKIFIELYTFLAALDCGGPHNREEEEHREYILPEGAINLASWNSIEPAKLKRELIEPWQTESTIYTSHVTSSSAHQLFMASVSPIVSPRASEAPTETPSISRPETPPLPDNASSSTLTPEKSQQESDMEGIKALDVKTSVGTTLETFYDAKMRESPRSSHEALYDDDGNLEENSREGEKSEDTGGVDSGKLAHTSSNSENVEYSRINTELNVANAPDEEKSTSKTSCMTLKSDSSERKADAMVFGHGDVNHGTLPVVSPPQFSPRKRKMRGDICVNAPDVPGIGPVVDPIQVRSVIDYLEGMAMKQEGMIKPSNIRHFLCPPLEKVPASQKTKV